MFVGEAHSNGPLPPEHLNVRTGMLLGMNAMQRWNSHVHVLGNQIFVKALTGA